MNYDDFTNYENEMPWEHNLPEGDNDNIDIASVMEEEHYDAYNFFPDAGF